MAFVLKIRLPQYRGDAGITVRITALGDSARVNGVADDAMTDTAADGLFLATIDEDLVGDFEYEVFRGGSITIQTGLLHRDAEQAIVLADLNIATISNQNAIIASLIGLTSGPEGIGQLRDDFAAAVTEITTFITDSTPTVPPAKSPPVVRSADNTLPITFLWNTNVVATTFVVRRSINGGDYVAAAGAITYLRAEGDRYRYSLAYNAADRPSEEGTVIYELTSGSVTGWLSVQITDDGLTTEIAAANTASILAAIAEQTGGSGDFLLTVQVNSTASGNPGIHNVRVGITGSLKQQFTGTLGDVIFRVEAGSYTLNFVVPPAFVPIPDLLVSDIVANREVTVLLTPVVIPSLDDVLLCNCLVVVLDQLGEPVEGATVVPVMIGLGTNVGDSFVFNESHTFTTDVDGRVYMPLHRKQVYNFYVAVAGVGETSVVKRIPDLPTYQVTVNGQVPGVC